MNKYEYTPYLTDNLTPKVNCASKCKTHNTRRIDAQAMSSPLHQDKSLRNANSSFKTNYSKNKKDLIYHEYQTKSMNSTKCSKSTASASFVQNKKSLQSVNNIKVDYDLQCHLCYNKENAFKKIDTENANYNSKDSFEIHDSIQKQKKKIISDKIANRTLLSAQIGNAMNRYVNCNKELLVSINENSQFKLNQQGDSPIYIKTKQNLRNYLYNKCVENLNNTKENSKDIYFKHYVDSR